MKVEAKRHKTQKPAEDEDEDEDDNDYGAILDSVPSLRSLGRLRLCRHPQLWVRTRKRHAILWILYRQPDNEFDLLTS